MSSILLISFLTNEWKGKAQLGNAGAELVRTDQVSENSAVEHGSPTGPAAKPDQELVTTAVVQTEAEAGPTVLNQSACIGSEGLEIGGQSASREEALKYES